MRETHLPLMSRGGWIFLKQHLAWQITLEKQTFAKLKVRNMLVQNYLKLEIDHARAILLATYE